MPLKAPGQRYVATATKVVNHGDPCVEVKHPGIAHKSTQAAPMAPSVANAALAVQIAIGEQFVIDVGGVHEVVTTKLPGGAVAGDPLWVRASDNTLQNAATSTTGGITNAGFTKFGVIDSIDTVLGRALVNLNLRDSF